MRWLDTVVPERVRSFFAPREGSDLSQDPCGTEASDCVASPGEIRPTSSDQPQPKRMPLMFDDVKVFQLPRDVNDPAANEDSYCCDEHHPVAAVADGVAGGIFSDRWAAILTSAVFAAPPNLDDAECFRAWLAECRSRWSQGIDLAKLGYFHRRRLTQVRGGYATLLWLEAAPAAEGSLDDGDFGWKSAAVGDCCLFHVRDGRLLKSFPIETSEAFGLQPPSLGSADSDEDELFKFERWEGSCRTGDLFALCSDAIACTLIQTLEKGDSVDWDSIARMDEPEWTNWVVGMREAQRIRFDDTTMVLLTVGEPARLSFLREPGSEASHEPLPASEHAERKLKIISDADEHSAVPVVGKDVFPIPRDSADQAWDPGKARCDGSSLPSSESSAARSASDEAPTYGEQRPPG